MKVQYKILSLAFLAITKSYAISNEALYNRCYSTITNDLAPQDSRYSSVVLKDSNPTLGTDAITACLEVFNTATFDSNDRVYDNVGKQVLKRMNDFHRSFFVNDNFQHAFPDDVVESPGKNMANIMDANNSALYYTRALFKPGTPAKSIVTSSVALKGVREYSISNTENYAFFLKDLGQSGQRQTFPVKQLYNFAVSGTQANPIQEPVSVKAVQFGTLVGVTTNTEPVMIKYFNGKPQTSIHSAPDTIAKAYEKPLPPAHDITKAYGGGLLGTQEFMLLNWGLVSRKHIDGGIITPRRLAYNAFKILFDRTLPVVQLSHVSTLVKADSSIAFRKSSSCMQCHATMDQMAYTYRNFKYHKSAMYEEAVPGGYLAFMVPTQDGVNINKSAVSESLATEQSPWPENDQYFNLRPTNGKIYFSDYKGSLVDINVSSIPDLGQKISELDDFYINLAKKYFLFLTGINVNISNLDINPMVDDEFKSKKIEYRNFVIKLGKELKSDPNQSLKTMMTKILRSEAFKNPGLGVE